jgi:molecular chaperone DnaK
MRDELGIESGKSLGKFILDGIPPAPRGLPQIEVTFDIDANGILKVTASDKATGRSQHITITASSGLSESEIERMRREGEAHAEEDRKRKDLIEARNYADNVIYTAEKTLTDLGDKVPGDLKTQVQDAIAKLRTTAQADDPAAIRAGTDELGQILQKIGASAYQQQPQAGGPTPEQGGPQQQQGPSGEPGGEDVVEGEFKNE